MNAVTCEAKTPGRGGLAPGEVPSPPRRGPMPATSCLYECRVLHHRFAPREHRFAYRLFYLCVDLDDLACPSRRVRLLAFNRAGILSLHERDFLPTGEPLHRQVDAPVPPRSENPDFPGTTLKARVLSFCAAHGVHLGPDARVQLITLPRLLGYQFNPVSFYFCFDRDGTPRAAIAEVTNTFREVKPYFVPLSATARTFHRRVPKHFYVSPFSSVDVEFDFVLRPPERRLAVRIDDHDAGRRVLHSTLTGERAELSNTRLAWFLVKYPLVTLGVVARIHWQALRLWGKRLPFFRKAAAAERQRDLYRPHLSISNRTAS